MPVSTLVKEDGSNVTGANTYVTVAEADQYFLDSSTGATWTAETDEDVKTAALLQATRLVDSMIRWNGARLYLGSQTLEWPRQYVRHPDGTYFLDPNVIPQFLKDAQCEMAKVLLSTDVTAASSEVGISSLKVDVIEIAFDGKTITQTLPKIVMQLLSGYGHVNYGGGFQRVRLA